MKILSYNKTIIAALLVSVVVISCDKKELIYQPNVVVDPTVNNSLDVNGLPPIAEPNNSGSTNPVPNPQKEVVHLVKYLGGGTNPNFGNFIDLSTGHVFSNADALANNHKVDLMMINFGIPRDTYIQPAGNNLIVPDSKELAYNSYGNDVQRGWDIQNKGKIYRLSNLEASDILWFNKVIKNQALKKGIDSFINEIIPIRNAAEHADEKAKKRLRKVEGLSMVFFKSEDRHISSVLVTTSINTVLGTEQIKVNFKTDASTKVDIAPGSGALKATRDDMTILDINFDPTKEQVIGLNFTDGVYYSSLDDAPSISDVSLTFTFRPSDKRGFIFTPGSSWYVNWKPKPAVQDLLDLLATSVNYTRFATISKNEAYENNTIENAKNNTYDLRNYYFSIFPTVAQWQSQLDNSGNDLNRTDIAYPLVFRFARTSRSGAGDHLEYGAFAVLERDFNAGKIKIGLKHSPIRN
jgi:hypothetical protein